MSLSCLARVLDSRKHGDMARCKSLSTTAFVGTHIVQSGEIDVIEGVHDNEHNQVTWHTMANCSLTPSTDLFSGSLAVRISVWYWSEPHSFNFADRKLH